MERCFSKIGSNLILRGKEGAARTSKKEFANFLSIALGSASELETQLVIASNLKYISSTMSNDLVNRLIEIRKMIHGLMKNIKQKF